LTDNDTERTQELGEPTVDERITGGTDAHSAAPDEDPMDHLGDELPDPWSDEAQDDWANEEVEV
jgi:hypothetical protein